MRQAARGLVLAAVLAWLGGCQGGRTMGGEVDLYHDLQGGEIAKLRPPPPGVNDPFPNLGSIPARPPPPDIIAEQRIADQLASQRDQAEHDAAANPLTPRQPPPATPKPAAPDPNANRVVVDAAPTPPAPATAAATPKPAAPSQPAAAASPVPSLASVPAVAAPLVSGPLPSIAAAPPAAPIGLGPVTATPVAAAPGVSLTASAATAAAATPASPPTAATATKPLIDRLLSPTVTPIPPGDTIYKAPVVPVTSTVAISFTPGSAELPPSAPLNLRRFALAHKGVAVTVTGHGEAVLPGADSQSRALDLALRRAQAIAASLAANGIPAVNLHLHAEAAGIGGQVSL